MKSLAQPMGANWSRKREAALAIDAQEKSLKSQNIEMQERMKRTCQLLIWYKVRESILNVLDLRVTD